MQQILDFLSGVGWETAGVTLIVSMLWWVTEGRSFFERRLEKRRAKEAREQAEREEDRRLLEENLGLENLPSSESF